MIDRRKFSLGLLFCAPAIIRPGLLMPIKPALVPAPQLTLEEFTAGNLARALLGREADVAFGSDGSGNIALMPIQSWLRLRDGEA
jgi:DNA-binding transcriptional LysR family regulator